PLAGMPLKDLHCHYTDVSNLAPLAGMPLTYLGIVDTRVADLSPLTGMPLTHLDIGLTRVADLSPLAGMPLTFLNCGGTQVADLSPLKGMPLTDLSLGGTRVADLSSLTRMPLTSLNIGNTRVADLSPLAGMPLTRLDVSGLRVADLSPLAGMPLKWLNCLPTPVVDFSPLEGLPLEEVWLQSLLFDAAAARVLRGLPLKKLALLRNHWNAELMPAEEAWKRFAARREAVEEFARKTAHLSAPDQATAVAARLTELNPDDVPTLGRVIEGDAVAVAMVALGGHTHDVTPLRAFAKLKKLTLTGGPHWLDISAVNSLPLEELSCSEDIAFRNGPVLRGMPTLQTINGQPAAEYLDTLQAKFTSRKPASVAAPAP
ncbi:MAG: hypothetical protein KY476_22515, partial [Planctomycetes bacterium]|nr:hypothetical protein [Planctomycetota bacterium]